MAEPSCEPKARILVVDDHEQNRALAAATLEDEGYEVTSVASGVEALASCDRLMPDCVVLDVRMPGMDGIEVCKTIRNKGDRGDIPILFLTALRDVDTFDRSIQAGGDDFLTKPVRPAELVTRVEAALRLRKMSVELREQYSLARKQRDDLLRLSLQKERLMAFVVHDLKNPVHAIDLQAQLLVRDPELGARARESAESIRESTRTLLRLVLNLLDLAKAEEGNLLPQKREVKIAPLFQALTREFGGAGEVRGVTLAADANTATVFADPDLLRRMLENLIDNALRFAPKGSTVRLGAERREQDTEVTVRDEGPGLPIELRDKVFERFFRVDEAKDVRGGRGLGLSFCRMSARAHGGDAGVREASPGSTFFLRFPHGT